MFVNQAIVPFDESLLGIVGRTIRMNDVERILVIDDDVELCSLVSEYLRPEGFQVEAVHDGKTGLTRAISGEHLLIVLMSCFPA